MIEKLRKILQEKFLITSDKISAQQGGWASLAYKIEDKSGHLYFLKVYEKSRKSTSYLIENIDLYLPIVDWLHNQTCLGGKIIRLVKTRTQSFKFEDESYVYVLFDYINGETVGSQSLTEEQVFNLAEIVSQLHNLKDFPFETKQISETFHLPFTSKLGEWTSQNFYQLEANIKEILKPKLSIIENQLNELKYLSKVLKEQNLNFCLCHTDIHNWNIIVNDKRVYLLDWEGIKFAPPEADIFSIYKQPYFSSFIEKYCELNPNYQVNNTVLHYYLISRKLQDIFEFIEQLQFDELNQENYKINLNYLKKEVNGLGDV